MVSGGASPAIDPGAANAQEPEIKHCAYCRAPFVQLVRRGSEARFCCASHRMLWHKHGTLSMGLLMERMDREMQKCIGNLRRSLSERDGKIHREVSELRLRIRRLEAALQLDLPLET